MSEAASSLTDSSSASVSSRNGSDTSCTQCTRQAGESPRRPHSGGPLLSLWPMPAHRADDDLPVPDVGSGPSLRVEPGLAGQRHVLAQVRQLERSCVDHGQDAEAAGRVDTELPPYMNERE